MATAGNRSISVTYLKKLTAGVTLICMFTIIVLMGLELEGDNPSISNFPQHLGGIVSETFGSWIPGSGIKSDDIRGGFFTEKKPRLMCLVLTAPKFHATRAKAVMETWGKKCDHIFFLSNKEKSKRKYPYLNLLLSDAKDNYKTSWPRLMMGFEHVYKNLLDEVDWVMKADDDTYVIMENLKAFLEDKDPDEPVYYGLPMKNQERRGIPMYMDGGSGYIMSKTTFQIMMEKGLPNNTICPWSEKFPNEDYNIGRCLSNLGIRYGITKDKTGHKFHQEGPVKVFNRNIEVKVPTWLLIPTAAGLESSSVLTISFHHVTPEEIYTLDMIIYKIKVVGLHVIENLEDYVSEERNQEFDPVKYLP